MSRASTEAAATVGRAKVSESLDGPGIELTTTSIVDVTLPQYRKLTDDDNDNDDGDVDSAVVGAGEGGTSPYYHYSTDKAVDYGAVYGSNFASVQDNQGTPRSKNLLRVLQNSVSLKEVVANK